ncbi:dolichyl-P-Man:Man(5)GlcNAc(2)-PP-dolichol alpha-1,3-mannosyltransferase [Coemansia linderi]|uniref:Dolichyl-P-Man:Man(5)GlcNAc(2)-PP-dolichol alpha-1,3-mannosyltransferase n=1 Tax=Coemansia linderi TaxID=2663919 RepID=A0ACC1KGM9_9FUNG|nr:dolichyl-P-Man:Man(5)GlcNAc(2)-PP-dolichol alpha-1,3-mannosyltransferase [Coemansia linderi]
MAARTGRRRDLGTSLWQQARGFLAEVLFTQRFYLEAAVLLVAFEAAATLAIVQRVNYTEIDWLAYMQEVAGVIAGERNYTKLRGATGPLVYPAGFVWIFGLLWQATDGGQDIRLAQYVFLGIYVATQVLLLAIYQKARVPPVLAGLLVLSRRLHSIYVLRLFNDCVAMVFAYIAVLAMCDRRWMRWSGLLLSAGIAVKMNVVLMLPGAAFLWWRAGGWRLTLAQAAAVVASQVAVAVPFLYEYPVEYVTRAFDLGRQFDFTWTVNWRFVGLSVFESPQWALALVATHAALLATLGLILWPRLFGSTAWTIVKNGFLSKQLRTQAMPGTEEVLSVMFSANFVGVVCARSLHYQFYAWYFHTLPFLLHVSRLPLSAQLGVWVAIEYAWNIYPSTVFSSALLAAAHIALLAAIMRAMALPRIKRKSQ